jgi:hypothetical protein
MSPNFFQRRRVRTEIWKYAAAALVLSGVGVGITTFGVVEAAALVVDITSSISSSAVWDCRRTFNV